MDDGVSSDVDDKRSKDNEVINYSLKHSPNRWSFYFFSPLKDLFNYYFLLVEVGTITSGAAKNEYRKPKVKRHAWSSNQQLQCFTDAFCSPNAATPAAKSWKRKQHRTRGN